MVALIPGPHDEQRFKQVCAYILNEICGYQSQLLSLRLGAARSIIFRTGGCPVQSFDSALLPSVWYDTLRTLQPLPPGEGSDAFPPSLLQSGFYTSIKILQKLVRVSTST